MHVLGGVQGSKSPADVVGAGRVGLSNVTAPGASERNVTQNFQQFCTRKARERLGDGGEESSTGREGNGPSPACPFPSLPRRTGLHRAPRVLGTPHTFCWCEGQLLPHGAGMGGPTPPCWVQAGKFGEPQLPLVAHFNAGTRDGVGVCSWHQLALLRGCRAALTDI